MWEFLLYFFGYAVFGYSLLLLASYVMLLIFSYKYSSGCKQWSDDYIRHMVQSSPYVPGNGKTQPSFQKE